jgi:hypothetical protein
MKAKPPETFFNFWWKLEDYDRISNFVLEMGIKYLDIPPNEMRGV